ncbi:MMPL family transporter, partial [bacterium]|nr:MMPL family transporter [bacterium]
YVYPNFGEWVTDVPEWFIKDIKGIDKGIKITGINLASKATKEIIKSDALKASFFAFIVVVGIIILCFRKLRAAVIILVPLMVGLVWMFGLSAIFGQPVNLINVFSAAIILGVGVDYGVHVFHRYQEAETFEKREIISQSKGITLAALTTLLGFASLALSSNPGVSSLGILVAFGVISVWLIAMTVLPAIFKLISAKKN